MLAAYIVFATGVNLSTIFALNGAILGYIYIILFPIYMHFKCLFIDRSSGMIENDDEWNSSLVPNACECQALYSSKWKLYL